MRSNRTMNCSLLFVLLVACGELLAAQELHQRPRYLLHEGDQMSVHFPLTPEFDQQVTIQPDGYVILTVGGESKVAGLDVEQATTLIRDHASVRLKDPEVHLVLTDFQHPYFVVAGEVNNPNRYELREPLTALQAVMFAGGTRVSGKDTQIIYIHDAASPRPEVRSLNMKHINSKLLSENPSIQPGDIIFVPRSHLTNLQQWTNIITPIAGYASPAATIAATAH